MNPTRQDTPDPFNTKRPVVHRLSFPQRLVFYPLAWALRLWFFTWRIRLDDTSREALLSCQPPRLIVVWHNRSLPMPEVFRRCFIPEKVACLISPSRMAAWEVAFFELFRLRVVRGSSTRRSIQATLEMLRELRAGNDVGISPDGPSGPLYSFQHGAAAVARKARVPVLLVTPNARLSRRLRTWDRHLVPWPFARINVAIRVVFPEDPVWAKEPEQIAAELRRLCLEITRDPFHAPDHE